MTADLVSLIAEVQREHMSMDAGRWCRCRQSFSRTGPDHAEHVAGVVVDRLTQQHAIVELPEPTCEGDG